MTKPERPSRPAPRVLITKIGLDGHDRGRRIVAGYLRDGGEIRGEVTTLEDPSSIEKIKAKLAA